MGRWLAAMFDFADGQVQLAARHVNFDDEHFGEIADGDFLAAALAADAAGSLVDVPPIIQ